jgi:hypothetical protein
MLQIPTLHFIIDTQATQDYKKTQGKISVSKLQTQEEQRIPNYEIPKTKQDDKEFWGKTMLGLMERILATSCWYSQINDCPIFLDFVHWKEQIIVSYLKLAKSNLGCNIFNVAKVIFAANISKSWLSLNIGSPHDSAY